MALKVLGNLTNDVKPVIVDTKSKTRYISCAEFKGEISSITGIASKFLYVPKISQKLSNLGDTEPPEITIVCSPECKEYCINLKNYKQNNDKS